MGTILEFERRWPQLLWYLAFRKTEVAGKQTTLTNEPLITFALS